MRKVLITGASRGLGRALATVFVEKGYDVIASARNPEIINLEGVYKKIQLDVTNTESINNANDILGNLDILINNAALSISGPVEAIPITEAQKLFATNFFGPIQLMQAVIPGMRKKGSGMLVNISSSASQFAPPYGGFYAASKAALEKVSEELRFELKHFGIEVMVMQCGAIDTEIANHQERFQLDEYSELDQQMQAGFEKYKQQNNRTSPEEVANKIIWAIEQSDHPFTTIIGSDAAYMLDMRKKMNDREWEEASLLTKNLKW